jgi:UPF0042 nucleotide-binding protein
MSEQQEPLRFEEPAGPNLVIITGMSGAGRTEAMHTFEDMGYFCIDNLPPSLILNLVSLAGLPAGSPRRLAVVCDLRSKEFFGELNEELRHIREAGISYAIIFLDATDDALLTRFKESRRRHPLCDGGMTIVAGINRERELLVEAREMANFVVDTSTMPPRELRRKIRELFSQETDIEGLQVQVFSFGFKHGKPFEADIVIDVRFLPNPFYEPKLRQLTGTSAEVREFVLGNDTTKQFIQAWNSLLAVVMPGYVAEGKQYLSIGVGCTGGQHRSVVLAEETAAYLKTCGYHTSINHRDLEHNK